MRNAKKVKYGNPKWKSRMCFRGRIDEKEEAAQDNDNRFQPLECHLIWDIPMLQGG